jgi:hypothetical protein
MRGSKGACRNRLREELYHHSLSKLGRTIIMPLRGMCRCAKRHQRVVSANVHRVETGQPAVDGKRSGLGTHMFLIARRARNWQA